MASKNSQIFDGMIVKLLQTLYYNNKIQFYSKNNNKNLKKEEKMNKHHEKNNIISNSNMNSQIDLHNVSKIDEKINNNNNINNTYNQININAINPISIMDKKTKHIQKEYYHYLDNTGISTAFEIIFNEIVANQINQDDVFEYTAKRLREIGLKLKEIDQL